jgi:hypothetical protein
MLITYFQLLNGIKSKATQVKPEPSSLNYHFSEGIT